jgi:hypothetical protein
MYENLLYTLGLALRAKCAEEKKDHHAPPDVHLSEKTLKALVNKLPAPKQPSFVQDKVVPPLIAATIGAAVQRALHKRAGRKDHMSLRDALMYQKSRREKEPERLKASAAELDTHKEWVKDYREVERTPISLGDGYIADQEGSSYDNTRGR